MRNNEHSYKYFGNRLKNQIRAKGNVSSFCQRLNNRVTSLQVCHNSRHAFHSWGE